MSPERARDVGESWVLAERAIRRQRCQIAAHGTGAGTQVAAPCGQQAHWWTDDLGPTTVWMCDDCCREVRSDNDSVTIEEVET